MLAFNGSTGRLVHTLAAPQAYPYTDFGWARTAVAGPNQSLWSEVELASGRRLKLLVNFRGNSTGIDALSLSPWGGLPNAGSNIDLVLGGIAVPVMVVHHSDTSITLYTPNNTSGVNSTVSNASAGDWANANTILVGAAYVDATYTDFWSGSLGEFTRWSNVALGATQFASLAGGLASEALSLAPLLATYPSAALYDVWDMNPAGAAGSAVTGTLTGLVNGRTMTVVGGVTTSGLSHPVSRVSAPVLTSPTGTATGNTTASGTVSTTGTDGTIWRKAQVGAATDPGAGNEASAGWLSQAVSASGTQTFSSFGTLTTNVAVVANYLHVSAGGLRSSVATSASFTPNTIITGPSGAAGASSSTANLAELATTGPTFSVSETLGGGYPTLTGADAASFIITTLSSTSFRVDPATPFNFESLPHANPFNITFNASATASQTCAISITNVNEAPTFSGTVSVPSLTEGVAMSAINAATLFSDPDSGDTGTYSAVGTWPTGVTVNSSGLISGTPGAGTAATYSSLRVRRTDGGGLTADSNVFAITVSASGAAPGVTTQPSNQTVTEGGVATFTAAFSNAPTGFAWEFSDSPYSSWSPVVGGSGATTASYTTGALILANSGRRFRCRGTNAFGSTNTNGTAQVTVNAAPAFSGLTDIISVSGIAQVGTTVYWTWFPSGRPGAATSPVQGSSVTNGAGRALITHSVAGDGMVLVGTRPGPLVSDDRVWLDFLTLA